MCVACQLVTVLTVAYCVRYKSNTAHIRVVSDTSNLLKYNDICESLTGCSFYMEGTVIKGSGFLNRRI